LLLAVNGGFDAYVFDSAVEVVYPFGFTTCRVVSLEFGVVSFELTAGWIPLVGRELEDVCFARNGGNVFFSQKLDGAYVVRKNMILLAFSLFFVLCRSDDFGRMYLILQWKLSIHNIPKYLCNRSWLSKPALRRRVGKRKGRLMAASSFLTLYL
jgi:hypothetical protein